VPRKSVGRRANRGRRRTTKPPVVIELSPNKRKPKSLIDDSSAQRDVDATGFGRSEEFPEIPPRWTSRGGPVA
jgi:hypothetical protein